jgi:hypothetical protein
VFPPEPPVAITIRPERRGDVKGATVFGAAQRTLDVEHRSGIDHSFDGRLGGNTFLLVGSEPR